MHKPRGWMDVPHAALPDVAGTEAATAEDDRGPRDDDERFIIGLVLTYYRRHPRRARARLLDLLGEVLIPGAAGGAPQAASVPPSASAGTPGGREEEQSLWLRSQSGVAPLKRKR